MADQSKVAEALKKIKTKKRVEEPISEDPHIPQAEGNEEETKESNAEIIAGLQNSGIYRKLALQRFEYLAEIGKAQLEGLKLIDEKLEELIKIFNKA